MRQLRKRNRLWRRSLTRSPKRTSMGPSRSCWNSTTSAFQPEEITSKGTRVSCVYYQLKCLYDKSLEICTSYFAKLLNPSEGLHIYCHTYCFVVSQLFSVATYVECFKLGLKPSWLCMNKIYKSNRYISL